MTLPDLFACGAMYEDVPGSRSLNHFFDPAHQGRPLTLSFGYQPGDPSPDWALQDNNSNSKQQFSYRHARRYFFEALTTPGPASLAGGRNDSWGLLFQSLGQVVHHIQDMAQPQHTRNDPHADWFDPLGDKELGQLRHPSRFERHGTSRRGGAKVANALGQAIVPVFPKYAQHFRLPRDFWTGADRGLADYSNKNFVSQGTNFIAAASGAAMANPQFGSPVPLPNPTTLAPTEAFSPEPVPPIVTSLCAHAGAYCLMTFYANQWSDPLTGTPIANPRASTESIFDEDLRTAVYYNAENGQVTTTRIFALNELNFNAALDLLVPRAVAYSAGLINYFFRGEMELLLPDEGIYSIVDHHAQRCKDACGFTKIKLKLKNTTPNESMSSGALRAVAKFHRNSCYAENLSGEPGGPAFSGIGCQSADEDAVVSDPLPLILLSSQEERAFTFSFPTPIPINATDLHLQVVFSGTLGVEHGAVAVVTKVISEPNYLAITNDTDMVYGFGDRRYHPFPYSGYSVPDSLRNMSVAFRRNAIPLATLSQLEAPGHAQLAFLTDPGVQYLDIRYASLNYSVGSPAQGEVPVFEFVSIPNTSLYGRTVDFRPSRGMLRNIQISHRLPANWTSYDCGVEVELCAQTTMPALSPATAAEWNISF